MKIHFTVKIVKSIKDGMLKDYRADLLKKLDQLTTSSNQADKLSKLKLKSLILDLIHHIGIIDILID